LDFGCGAGVPLSSELVEHGFGVVGLDCSAKQIVPNAEFVHPDMTAVTFASHSFHTVAAFYLLRIYLEKIMQRCLSALRVG
jgi:2-polyprenyl-3-methyl-5-hydroxy-6-metoxy-1,4-benzoquinol methylase